MKAFSLLMTLTLLAPAAFAQVNIADQLKFVSCDFSDGVRTGFVGSAKGNDPVKLVGAYLDAEQASHLSTHTLNSATISREDEPRFTLKSSGKYGSLELIVDFQGKAKFYKVNDIVQDIEGLTCTFIFKKEQQQ
jgi:hypothetical protein